MSRSSFPGRESLDDAAAGVARYRGCGELLLLLAQSLSLSLPLAARYPGAPGLLVLQGVVARALPEALEEALLLRRVVRLDTSIRTGW